MQLTPEQIRILAETKRYGRGADGCIEWIRECCWIENPQEGRWLRFDLWPEQEDVVRKVFDNPRTIALKARQLGLTWLGVAIALWFILFRPGSKIGLSSRRDDEAVKLLRERMRGMYKRLPSWQQMPTARENDHEWVLSNGSSALAFPTGVGDSYTLTFVLLDEADLLDSLQKALLAFDPTIEHGGRMLVISKKIKSKPDSDFAKIYLGADEKANGWCRAFLPFWVRPERTAEWYAAKCAHAMTTYGSLDTVHENYPATPEEALAPRELDRRFPEAMLAPCYREQPAIKVEGAPPIHGLRIYVAPEPGRRYVIGADPAEGNPNSDRSALEVLDKETWEQVASLAERIEPDAFAGAIDHVAAFFNGAPALVERNNHGHAVLVALRRNGRTKRLADPFDKKPGYNSTQRGKIALADAMASALIAGDVTIHDRQTRNDLAAIDGTKLDAPHTEEGHADRARAIMLALDAARRPISKAF